MSAMSEYLTTHRPPADLRRARIDRIKRASIGGAVACGFTTILGFDCSTTEFISSSVEVNGKHYGVKDEHWWNKEMGYEINSHADASEALHPLRDHLEAEGYQVQIWQVPSFPDFDDNGNPIPGSEKPPFWALSARRIYESDEEIKGWYWREAENEEERNTDES